jgi:hypothetical protein
MFETIVVLTYAFIANIPLVTFSWLFVSHYTTLTAWKFHSTVEVLLVLFKVKAFPFKNKDKSHIFHAKSTFTLSSASPCLFCFEATVTVYLFKLNCFKLIGWFYHHDVFPPIRSVCYRFLYCCYRFFHCCYRFLHCSCLWLTALKSTNHSRVIFLCILLKRLKKERLKFEETFRYNGKESCSYISRAFMRKGLRKRPILTP